MSDSLTFRLLRYIKVSAETLNFTRAAEQVFVARSSLSHQIGKLEDSIDVLIFDRTLNGLKLTPAGRIIASYAETTLNDWERVLAMARAVERREVPPLRLGFSSFVSARLLEVFQQRYETMFSGCRIQLVSGDPKLCLSRLDAEQLDCALLPLPIDSNAYAVQQVTRSPLMVCMRSDDLLATLSEINLCDVGNRITVFRDPEEYPAAHAKLVASFAELGLRLVPGCTARTPSEVQWMVKQRYGLALVDQSLPLDPELVTRPLAGLDWTADIALVHLQQAAHVALHFVERFFQDNWIGTPARKRPQRSREIDQLELLVSAR